MACKGGCKKGLSDEHKAILSALAGMAEPAACKDIAAAVGQESKKVSCKLTSLKKKGFIQSPARCRYEITEAGKAEI